MPYSGSCNCPPYPEGNGDVPIEEVPQKLCGFTAQRLSKAFLEAVGRMDVAKHNAKEWEEESSMFRERLLTIKEKYEEKFNSKTEEAERLTNKYSELLKFNKVLRDEKQELLSEIIELRKK